MLTLSYFSGNKKFKANMGLINVQTFDKHGSTIGSVQPEQLTLLLTNPDDAANDVAANEDAPNPDVVPNVVSFLLPKPIVVSFSLRIIVSIITWF